MKRRQMIRLSLAGVPAAFASCARTADIKKETEASTKNVATASTNANAVPDARTTAPLTDPPSKVITTAILLSEGAVVVDFAGPWAVFEQVMIGTGANHRMPFTLYTVAASKDPVRVSSGMTIVPEYTFANAPTPNVVVVPAMDTAKLAPATLDWLRKVAQEADVTMSVCNGSYVLGEAGLLDGKQATAHHGGYGWLRTYPKVTVVRGVRYVEDGKIATSGGLTSGMDLALRVVERYYGRAVAQQAATNLEYQSTGWMHPDSNMQWAKKPVGTVERPICPVCEMQIERQASLDAKLTMAHQGTTYSFCSAGCRDQFVKAPQKFL